MSEFGQRLRGFLWGYPEYSRVDVKLLTREEAISLGLKRIVPGGREQAVVAIGQKTSGDLVGRRLEGVDWERFTRTDLQKGGDIPYIIEVFDRAHGILGSGGEYP